jgi:hypothetical protein
MGFILQNSGLPGENGFFNIFTGNDGGLILGTPLSGSIETPPALPDGINARVSSVGVEVMTYIVTQSPTVRVSNVGIEVMTTVP